MGPRKAERNRVLHEVSFENAITVFTDPACIEIDTTRDEDGEPRLKAFGLIQGRLFTIVFTPRKGVTRIISARRSNRNEKRAYGIGPQDT